MTIATVLGWSFMPWQVYVAHVALEVQSEEAGDEEPGRWAYLEVLVTVQRQAGKTTLLTPVIAHRAEQQPRSSMWLTAQSGKKARDRWMSLTDVLLASPLERRIKRKVSHSHEELRWKSGAGTGTTLVPFAPTSDDLHGETPVLVTVDELWAFDAVTGVQLRGAYEPGFSTVDGQAWLTSTAGTEASAWLNAARRRGRAAVEAGEQSGTAYFEWSVPEELNGVPIEQLDDETLLELVLAWHPANGFTLRPALLRKTLRDTEDRSDWLRAYGNHAGDVDGALGVVSTAAMRQALAPDTIPADAEVTIGFEVDLELEESSVTAAWRDEDGIARTELIRSSPGSSWLATYLVGMAERQGSRITQFACGNAGPTRDVADRLTRLRDEQLEEDVEPPELLPPVLRIMGPDYSAACSRWLSETTATVVDDDGRKVPAPTVLHDGHPDFLAAVEAAYAHRRNGTVAFRRRAGGVPVTALPSAVAAVWGWDHPADVDEALGSFRMY